MKHVTIILLSLVLLLSACTEQVEEQTMEDTPEPVEPVEEAPAEVVEEPMPATEEPVEEMVVEETPMEDAAMDDTPMEDTPMQDSMPADTPEPTPTVTLSDGIVKYGKFQRVERDVAGAAELHVINGEVVLKLVDFNIVNENMKPVHVVLSGYHHADEGYELEQENYVDLGEYVTGQDTYTVSGNVNPSDYLTAAIYLTGPPQIVFATAPLGSVA